MSIVACFVTGLFARRLSKFKVSRQGFSSLVNIARIMTRAASIFYIGGLGENAGITRAISVEATLRAKYFPSAWRSLDFVAMPSRQFLRGWLLTVLA